MIKFTKMQGIGNDFVMVDLLQTPQEANWADLARKMCDRKFGVGSDGLILLEKGDQHPLKMVMFNPDGSESEMCGNGIRCFAALAKSNNHFAGSEITVETGAGPLPLKLLANGHVEVGMGKASFDPAQIGLDSFNQAEFIEQNLGFQDLSGIAVSMGNPHLVIFVDELDSIPLLQWGPQLEHLPIFKNRTNVHFVQIISSVECKMKTWERGAGATLASGTGACSVAAAGLKTSRLTNNVLIHLPGGDLNIKIKSDWSVQMTGPATFVFEGTWPN